VTEGKCPSCGAPVAFTAGTALVVVCGYCQTVVARKGASLEDHGKVARIVETDTPFQLGAEGRYGGKRFTLVGHLQKDHGAGPWDEWYVEFADGTKGWLTESEGAFHLLFDAGTSDVPLAEFEPGKPFDFKGRTFVAEEVGHYKVVAGAGELPDDVDGSDARYVDATGPKGVFLSLDFGQRLSKPDAFVGQRVALEELGIAASQLRPKAKKAELAQIRCPKCNGMLNLHAPDQTQRVACPFCGALSSVSGGNLQFLELLKLPKKAPLIPLGAKGTLAGTEWINVGFQRRYCIVEGVRYEWDEFLLYHRARGFTFLMQDSNDHWVHLKPIAAGDLAGTVKLGMRYQGRHYKAFQKVEAITDIVLGEFYWKVKKGESTWATEYVSPPYSISSERTPEEVTYTFGEYLSPDVVKAAFKLKAVPRPRGIAPSMPNPRASSQGAAWRWFAIWAAALLALFLVNVAVSANELVHQEQVIVPMTQVSNSPESMHFSAPFEIKHRGNVQVDLHAWPVSQDWFGLQGDLVNEETGEVTSFYQEVSYYSGSDSDGAWSEGSTVDTEFLSAVPPGRYVLRTIPYFARPGQSRTYEIKLTSDVPRATWFLLALGAMLAWALVSSLSAGTFETQRWNDSNLAGGSDSDD